MAINVSVQYNGGFLPDIILLTLHDYIGEPFGYHEEFLSLQPKFPPKSFGNFSSQGGCSEGGCSEGLDAFRFLLNSDESIFVYPWQGESPTGESPFTHLII